MLKKGFTLIELLIVIFIFGLVMTAVYLTFNSILKDSKSTPKEIESQFEGIFMSEIIRKDIEHANYGLIEQNTLPLEYDNGTLTIRSTINITNQKTIGWALADVNNGKWTLTDYIENIPSDTPTNKRRDLVTSRLDNKQINLLYNINLYDNNTTLQNGKYVIFPFDNSTTNGCSTQFCNIIKYRLSTTQTIPTCNPNTKNLLRAVGSANGDPIISCVADVKYKFIISGNPLTYSDSLPATKLEMERKLKSIDMYILVQTSNYNPSYNFTGIIDNNYLIHEDKNNDGKCGLDEICLKLPSIGTNPKTDYRKYKWRIIKLSIEAKNINRE